MCLPTLNLQLGFEFVGCATGPIFFDRFRKTKAQKPYDVLIDITENLLRSMKYLIALATIAIVGLASWLWFQSQSTPRSRYYGRALFGDSSTDSAAWLHFIVQGNRVFVDQNKDDVADATEVFASRQGIRLTVGEREYSIVSAQPGIIADAVSDTLPQRLHLEVDVLDDRPYRMAGKMLLTDSPDECNWLQFGGDLQFIVMDRPRFRAGAKAAAELKIFIGTPTSGSPSTNAVANKINSAKPDVFRTAIVIPVRQTPYPTLELAFDHDGLPESATQQLLMDQFC